MVLPMYIFIFLLGKQTEGSTDRSGGERTEHHGDYQEAGHGVPR